MPKNLPFPGLLSYADMAAALSCSKATVRRMWQKGALPAPHDVPELGPRWFEDDLIGLLASIRQNGRQQPPQGVSERKK